VLRCRCLFLQTSAITVCYKLIMRTLCILAVLVGSCVLAAPAHATDHSCRRKPRGLDVAVSIDDGRTTLVAGGSTTYTIVVTNDGPRTAKWLDIDVAFPETFADVVWTVSGDGGARCGDVCDWHSRGHGWAWGRHDHGSSNVGDIDVHSAWLPAGASCTFTADATLSSAAKDKVTVVASAHEVAACPADTDPWNDSASDTDTVGPASDPDPKAPPSETPEDPKDPPSETPEDPKDPPSETVPRAADASGEAESGADPNGTGARDDDDSQGGCNATGHDGIGALLGLLVLWRVFRRAG
jgi:uncharacterized protein (TIGR03382 family)/uncharacterized repeat protein (TIGR01451 family)